MEGLERDDYRDAMNVVKEEMETAIQNRISSLDRFHSLQQRRRRMSFAAPLNNKGNALDFEERIAICKTLFHIMDGRMTFFVSREFSRQ